MLASIAKKTSDNCFVVMISSYFVMKTLLTTCPLILNKKQRDLLSYISFFLEWITGINHFTILLIAYRWWDFFYFAIHIKMQYTMFKVEKIARWYVLIKLIGI